MKMKWNAEWKLYGVIALQDKMKWLHDKIEIEYNNYKMKIKWNKEWKWNGVRDENEMKYRTKIKWITGQKWNGALDKMKWST